jgi:secretory phospholipase A2
VPISNGCGAYNMNFDFNKMNLYGFNECCDEHDYCYGTCNKLKKDCDQIFKKCLLGHCKNDKKSDSKQNANKQGFYNL